MKFDQFTVVLLMLRPDAPELDEAAAAALQDAHLAFLAELPATCWPPGRCPMTDSAVFPSSTWGRPRRAG